MRWWTGVVFGMSASFATLGAAARWFGCLTPPTLGQLYGYVVIALLSGIVAVMNAVWEAK
jgi:hypothetical protein